jgi:penicillin-binding protein 1A
MSVAHQGIEIRELPGVGMGVKLPQPAAPQTMAAYGAPQPKPPEIKPGPPPVLTKRGADLLVQIEKMLDDAAKTAEKTSAGEPSKPGKPVSSSALPFPDNLASASSGDATSQRKN